MHFKQLLLWKPLSQFQPKFFLNICRCMGFVFIQMVDGVLTKMATMPIYGTNHLEVFFSRAEETGTPET